MASSSAEKFEWLVIMPDQPNKLAKRMEIRPYVYLFKHFVQVFEEAVDLIDVFRAHFEGLKEGLESGFWKMGGEFNLLSF